MQFTLKQITVLAVKLEEKKRMVTLLLVSDIHEDLARVDQLAAYLAEHYITHDAVLYLGDFLSLKHTDEAEEQQGLLAVEKTLCELSTKLNGGERVLYVPGNHDPEGLFCSAPGVTEHGVLLHNRLVRLLPKDAKEENPVVLLGLGGSSPGVSGGSVVWSGYPFETDSALKEAFCGERCATEVPSVVSVGRSMNAEFVPDKAGCAGSSVVLVTHQGPSGSSTGVYTKEEAPIYSGSDALLEAIAGNPRIVGHVHGHTHDAWGVCTIKGCTVVNPGPMKYGRCALVTLASDGIKWSVTETELLEFSH